jgi:hypothetical protein
LCVRECLSKTGNLLQETASQVGSSMKVFAIASLLLCVCLPGSVAGQTPVSTGSGSSRGVDVSKSRPTRETPAVPPKHFANPLAFEANVGQTDKRVKFLARGQGYSLFLTDRDAVFVIRDQPANPKRSIASHEPSPSHAEESSFRMSFVGANPAPQVSGTDKLDAQSNYLIGNDPEQWHIHVSNYGKVLYTDLYPGISALYYGNDRKLEYDFKVQPGAALDRIALALDGAADLHLDKSGDVAFHCGTREVGIQKPTIYQISDAGARLEVSGSWVLKNGHTLGFSVPKYDHSRELVIDPSFNFGQISMPLFTYVPSNSGSGYTQGNGIAMGPGNSVYIAGYTDLATFPETSGKLQTSNPSEGSQYAGFVSMFNSFGELQWSTFLGGESDVQSSSLPASYVYAIAVNSSGNPYVTGQTFAHGSFPTSPSQTGCGSPVTATNCSDVFVTELSSNGASLVYSNFIDGSAGWVITLDTAGNAYVGGQTDGAGTLTGVVQTTFGGGECDAFVAKVSVGGSESWWTYLGGSGDDVVYGIALDSKENVYVTGDTTSANYPTANAFQASSGSGGTNYTAFVTELNNAGTKFAFSTYLGGSGVDYGQAIAVDSLGGILVAGQTTSANFPILKALQPTFPTSPQAGIAFLTKFAPGGASLDYSTYLGGSQGSDAWAITTDSNDDVYVGGVMQTPATTPVPANPNGFLTIAPIDSNLLNLGSNAIQPQCGDYPDVTCNNGFVTEIGPTGNQFLYFTYIGGNGQTGVLGMALDTSAGCSEAGEAPLGAPCIYATGYTSSSDAGSSDGSTLGSASYDAFVAQIPSLIEPVCSPTLTEVGLKVTVTLTCTQDFTGGQGAVNWGDGTALTTISLQGTDTTSTPVSHTYEAAATVTSSVSMTDSAGNQTSYATPFPVTQLAPVTVTISAPSGTSVADGSTLALSAYVQNVDGVNGSNQSNAWVTWNTAGAGTVAPCANRPAALTTPADSGQVTDCGVYTPPEVQSPTQTTVAGTDVGDGTTQSTALTLTIYPALALSPGTTQTVQVTGTAFTIPVSTTPSQSVNWTLTGTGCSGLPCGSINSTIQSSSSFAAGPSTSVVYTVPANLPSSAQVTDVLTATTPSGEPDQTATVSFVINPSAVGVQINPSAPQTVVATQASPIPFTATVSGTTNMAVTWSLSGSGCNSGPCGSLNTTTGVYTPPTAVLTNPAANTSSGVVDTVTATSQVDTTKSASDQITIYNPSNVTLNPNGNTVQAVTSQAFTVTATLSPALPSQSLNFTWQLSGTGCSGAPCGSLSTAGPSTSTVYTPPAGLPTAAAITDRLTATSVAEPTQSGVSAITVTPLPVSVSISPTPALTVVATQSSPIQFTATVTGPSNPAVTWTLSGTGCSGAPCGTLSPSGLYTPPGSAIANFGSIDTVTATSQADPTKSASTTVTINDPVTISISPAGVGGQFSIEVGQSQSFTSIVTGSSNTSVTWSVTGTGCSGGPCGTITQPTSTVPATYTAPATLASSQTDTIVATSAADPTKTATIKAVIFLPAAVSSPPPSVTVAPGGTATYTVNLNPGTGDPLYGETLSCFNAPNGVSCVFTPNPLPGGVTSFTVQVTTTASGVSSLGKESTTMLAGLVPLIGLFLFGMRGSEYRKRLMRNFSLVVLTILLATSMIACGTSGSFGTAQMSNLLATPPGVYTITVQATSNAPAGQTSAPNAFTVTTLPLTVN